jgi:hypothetical protein
MLLLTLLQEVLDAGMCHLYKSLIITVSHTIPIRFVPVEREYKGRISQHTTALQ